MSLFAISDIHGNALEARRAVGPILPFLTTTDTLVCLGDVGIAYGDHVHDNLRRFFAKLPCTVLVLRGNHDTRYWRDMLFGDFAPGHAESVDTYDAVFMRDSRYPNTLYVPDGGGIAIIEGHQCLFVPGAWSIDGEYRQEFGLPFEPEEQLTETERDRLLSLAESHPVEHVFSHTCPLSWFAELDDLRFPPEFAPVTDVAMEDWLDDVLDACDSLDGWWFGHFHDDRDVACDLGHLVYHEARKVF